MDQWTVEICRTAEEYRACIKSAQEKGYKILMTQYVSGAWVVTCVMPEGAVITQ